MLSFTLCFSDFQLFLEDIFIGGFMLSDCPLRRLNSSLALSRSSSCSLV